MTTCTPVYQLPYIECTDDPCRQNETWCAFADVVEENLDRLDAIVDRSVDTIPMAKVRLTAPFSYDNGIGGNVSLPIPFDTVDVDTADMINLTANPTLITLPRFGRYSVSFQVLYSSVIPAGDIVGSTMFSFASDQFLSDASTPLYMNGAYNIRYFSPGPADTATGISSLTTSFSAPGITTISSATALVYWMGDL